MIKFSFSQETLISHLFNYFDTSLKYFRGKYLGLFLQDGDVIPIHKAYVCPLCLQNYILVLWEEKVVKATSDFDLDHFPQKSVGGKNTLLVCKSCNNEAGHNFEYDLKKHLELTSFGESGESHQVFMQTSIPDVGKFSGRIWRSDAGQWQVSLKPNEKQKIKPLDEWLEYSKKHNDWEIELTIPNPQEKNIERSIMKSAYLYCFSLWGYEFAFSEAGKLMLDVIRGNDNYPMAILPLKFSDQTPNYDKLPRGVCFISKPDALRSFVVNVEIKDKAKGFAFIHPVFIPNPTERRTEDLKQIQGEMDAMITGDAAFVPLNNILSSTHAAYTSTWEQMQELP